MANQRAAGQRMLPDMTSAPRTTIATPESEYIRQMMALQDAARLRGLLGSNFDQFNPQTFFEGMERDRLARQPLESERAAYMRRAQLEQDRLASQTNEVAANPEPAEYDGFVDSGTGERGYMGFKYMPVSMDVPVNTTEYLQRDRADGEIPESETPIIEEESSGYDGFVDSGTGERGYMGFKYMPAPMDVPVNTAYVPPAPVNTAYMPPAPVNTAYMPPPQAAPVNTAYMPPPQAAPVNTAYMPPASVNTAYNAPIRRPSNSTSMRFNPQALPTTPSYGVSTPSYGMSNATTAPTYRGQATGQPSYSPKQAGKYNVDGTRLRNTGGLFNDLNAFFGRPQT